MGMNSIRYKRVNHHGRHHKLREQQQVWHMLRSIINLGSWVVITAGVEACCSCAFSARLIAANIIFAIELAFLHIALNTRNRSAHRW